MTYDSESSTSMESPVEGPSQALPPAQSPAQPPVQPPAASNRRWRWFALALLGLGALLVVLFGIRTVRAWQHFHEVRGRPIGEDLGRLRPWMTIPDVARDFEVPLDYLYSELGVEPQTPDRRTLRDLNRALAAGERGHFEEKITGVIQGYRLQQKGDHRRGPEEDKGRPPRQELSPLAEPGGRP